jgi:hypothetical protein
VKVVVVDVVDDDVVVVLHDGRICAGEGMTGRVSGMYGDAAPSYRYVNLEHLSRACARACTNKVLRAHIPLEVLQVVSEIRACFCMYCFLDDHNFINNHPTDPV